MKAVNYQLSTAKIGRGTEEEDTDTTSLFFTAPVKELFAVNDFYDVIQSTQRQIVFSRYEHTVRSVFVLIFFRF